MNARGGDQPYELRPSSALSNPSAASFACSVSRARPSVGCVSRTTVRGYGEMISLCLALAAASSPATFPIDHYMCHVVSGLLLCWIPWYCAVTCAGTRMKRDNDWASRVPLYFLWYHETLLCFFSYFAMDSSHTTGVYCTILSHVFGSSMGFSALAVLLSFFCVVHEYT